MAEKYISMLVNLYLKQKFYRTGILLYKDRLRLPRDLFMFHYCVSSLLGSIAAIAFVTCTAICPVLAASTANDTPYGTSNQLQVINDASGQTFMEEVTPPKPAVKPPPKRNLDLSNVGVQVDSSGKIIPLINKTAGPVQRFYNRLQAYDEPAWNFLPPTVINPYGQVLNIYGQPIDAFGNPINQYGQPLNTWARLGVPFLGTTPPSFGLVPYNPFYASAYPHWNTGANLNVRIGKNFGLNLGLPLLP